MIIEMITGLANAIAKGSEALTPLIAEKVAQTHEKKSQETNREWLDIQAEPDVFKRADREFRHVLLLCSDSGSPVGGNGVLRRIPDDIYSALRNNTVELIQLKATIADLLAKR